MSAERRVDAVVLAVTVAIISAFVVSLPVPKREDSLKWAEPLVAVLTGVGLREFLLESVEFLVRRWGGLKQFLLGSSFVEGKWVGYYTEASGHRLVIQVIRQDWADLFINGRAFDEKGQPYGQWRSTMAMVDGQAGLVHGIFAGDFTIDHFDSIVTFQLEGKQPNRMSGLIVDTAATPHAEHAWIKLVKVDDDLPDDQALAQALQMSGR